MYEIVSYSVYIIIDRQYLKLGTTVYLVGNFAVGAREALSSASALIITFGTSYIYRLKEGNRVVANVVDGRVRRMHHIGGIKTVIAQIVEHNLI